jgi:hypothetical protein
MFYDLYPFVAYLLTLPRTIRLVRGIYEARRWDGLRCHGIYTKFHKHAVSWFGGFTETQTAWWTHKPTFSFSNKLNWLKIEIRCVFVNPPYQLSNAWTSIYETWYLCHGFSTAHFINPSHQFVCIYVYVARQRLSKNVTAAVNTQARIEEIVGRVVFYAVRVVSKESRRLGLPRTSCFEILMGKPEGMRPPVRPKA